MQIEVDLQEKGNFSTKNGKFEKNQKTLTPAEIHYDS